MPQLMPLYWMNYIFIFYILILMMKSVYSVYVLNNFNISFGVVKFQKGLWFW